VGRDLHDLNMAILDQLNSISRDTGPFVAGILSNDISRDDQLFFALRLMQLAAYIKERATSSVGMVIEGTAVDDDLRALPHGSGDATDRLSSNEHDYRP
jgi:hypothetical protein